MQQARVKRQSSQHGGKSERIRRCHLWCVCITHYSHKGMFKRFPALPAVGRRRFNAEEEEI